MLDWDYYGWSDPRAGGFATPSLGEPYLLTDSGDLVSPEGNDLSHLILHQGGAGAAGPLSGAAAGTSPASTVVGAAGGLQIDLIWGASVRGAANWQSVEAGVIAAAKVYTDTFSTPAMINIQIGLGEVNGSRLVAGAIGESESLGYITNYSTITHALANADTSLVSGGLVAPGAFSDSALSRANFFVTSAEAKALALVSPTGASVDGYIGLSASPSLLYFPAAGGHIGASQYDGVGVAAHEISEVMGRLGIEGRTLGAYRNVYTPLDLFRFSAPHQPVLSPTPGYFSTDLGATRLNSYNDPRNGGDASDWASTPSNNGDAYDAFANPGVTMNVTASDLLEVAVLGYRPAHALTTITA